MKKIITLILTLAVLFTLLAVVSFADSGYESWVDYGYGVRSQVDDIFADDKSIAGGSAGDYLSTNKYLISGEYETLRFEGWCGFDQIITAIGYTINDGENIYDGELIDADPESHAAAYGGDNVKYYKISVPVKEYNDKIKITLVALLEDETAVAINRYDVYYQKKTVEVKKKDVALTQGGTGTPVCFSDHEEIGFKIHIEDGWRLGQFVVINSPTWDLDGAGLLATIYKWNTDYDTSTTGKSVGTCLIENHINCTSMIIEFGYIPAGDYVITFTDFELKIGGYDATAVAASQKGLFEYYVDGEKTDEMIPQLKMVLLDNSNPPEITEEPTPEETPTPEITEAPATEPTVETEKPASEATEAPQVTDKPAEGKKGCGSVLTSMCGVFAIAFAGCFVVLKKKR